MTLCKEIAVAIQRKSHLTARAQPGEDRISVKGRDGTWRDYTSAEAAQEYGLKAYMKAPEDDAEPVAVEVTNDPPRTKRTKGK